MAARTMVQPAKAILVMSTNDAFDMNKGEYNARNHGNRDGGS